MRVRTACSAVRTTDPAATRLPFRDGVRLGYEVAMFGVSNLMHGIGVGVSRLRSSSTVRLVAAMHRG
jgi:hypothetical protein